MKRTTIVAGVLAGFAISNLTPAQAQAPIHHQVRKIVKVQVRMTPKMFAYRLVQGRGWSPYQFTCLVELWRRESNWRPLAKNRKSTAFGIAQMLTETSRDPFIQIRHGADYIKARYGHPCNALAFSNLHGYY